QRITRVHEINVGQPFQITASAPGVYRIAVASPGDINFNGKLDTGEGISSGDRRYTLFVSGSGDVALGGVVASQSIFTPSPRIFGLETSGFEIDRGDLGALHANVRIFSDSFGLPYDVFNGNLRDIDSLSIGYVQTGDAVFG